MQPQLVSFGVDEGGVVANFRTDLGARYDHSTTILRDGIQRGLKVPIHTQMNQYAFFGWGIIIAANEHDVHNLAIARKYAKPSGVDAIDPYDDLYLSCNPIPLKIGCLLFSMRSRRVCVRGDEEI